MALLHNISLFSTSKLVHLSTSKPSLSISPFSFHSSHLGFPSHSLSLKQNHHQPSQKLTFSFTESLSTTALIALLSASLFFVHPALAFKGGGPYGQEVTRGQDLTGKDFSGKTLIQQDFKTSILRQANFKGAKLLGASFFDADLTGLANILYYGQLHSPPSMLDNYTSHPSFNRYPIPTDIIWLSGLPLLLLGADLSDADLRSADFSLANVTKVNLSNANLEGALVTGNTSFKGSNITGADFTDVPLRDDQRAYLCKVADGVNPTTGNATRDTLLCK